MSYFDQFSQEQIKNQYTENAKGLKVMVARSQKTGTYNGYTTHQLEQKVVEYQSKAK